MSEGVPSIGRIVIYHYPINAADEWEGFPAIVTQTRTRAQDDIVEVCLTVFRPGVTETPKWSSESDLARGWHWPERQK